MFEGKRLLITGGTGSLGKTLVRRILSGEQGTPAKVIVLSRDEGKQHAMRVSYMNREVTTDEVIYSNFKQLLEFRIGDVRRYADLSSAIRDVDIVVHAAALKQVPTCEYFSEQAVLTNCSGAMNLVRAVHQHGNKVEAVVGVSTDKACKPINVMGMTKAIQERIINSAAVARPDIRFMCVRYGNVLASRGSVIPLFKNQIASGGPVTITDPKMTRFLLSLDAAVDTIFACLKNGEAGETFIPRVPAATVENIARAMIGDRSVETKIIGHRPGEKMHEDLIGDEERYHTVQKGEYYAIRSSLPEVCAEAWAGEPVLEKAYSSGDDVLDLEGTIALLQKHGLLGDEVALAEGGELLR